MTTARPVVALVAVLGLLATEAGAASAQGIPNIPGAPTIPGQETARFKVVVEGESRTYAEVASATSGLTGCNVAVKRITIDEQVVYGRGKGVAMEFVRFRAAGRQVITLQRSGRAGDASFAVKGTIARAVARAGLVTRAPADPRGEPVCPTATETPAARPGCNTTFPLSADMKFVYGARAATLKLAPTASELLGGPSPVVDCPSSEIFPGLSGLVAHFWPAALTLPAERLSTRRIFGSRRTFKVVFHNKKPDKIEQLGQVLTGSVNRYSAHDAVVRFTRLR